MVAAGRGEMMSLLDNEKYGDLTTLAPDLGQRWEYWDMLFARERILETMEEAGEPADNINQMKAGLDEGSQYHITAFKVGDHVVDIELEQYGDTERAEQKAEEERTNPPKFRSSEDTPQEWIDDLMATWRAGKVEVDGALVTTTTIYDEKLIESGRASMKAREKLREERKKKEESQDKEKGG
jgi:hypothetical protein